jgi:hypothetical protein
MARNRFWSSKPRPAVERFWAFVDKNGTEPPHVPGIGACWNWTGGDNGRYGTFGKTWRKPVYAHRFSWELHHGDPGEFHVCHRCDNPRCVRVSHLFLGTHRDNMADKVRKGRATKVGMVGDDNPRAILTAADVPTIRERYTAGGVTQEELAAEYGVSRGAIGSALRGVSWGGTVEIPPGKFYRRGSKTKNAKLDERAVLGILVTCGSCSTVAAAFGVTPGLINQIRTRKIWKHVTEGLCSQSSA